MYLITMYEQVDVMISRLGVYFIVFFLNMIDFFIVVLLDESNCRAAVQMWTRIPLIQDLKMG